MSLQRRLRFPLLLGLLILVMGVPSLVEFYTDWLWFEELGYAHVFLRLISVKSTVWCVLFGAAFAFLYGNLLFAFRTQTRREIVMVTTEGPRVVVLDPLRLRPLVIGASLVGALILAAIGASNWNLWLQYWNATSFGRVDPILGKDVAFYVFTLPLLESLQGLLLLALVPTMLVVGFLYVSAGRLGISPRRGLFAAAPALSHLSLLAAALLLTLAFGAWLEIPGLLTSASTILHGASYVDVNARMPMLRLLAVVAVIGAGLALYQVYQPRWWPIASAITLYIGVSLAGSAYASAMQRFSVAPNEQVKETPYIIHNIDGTRAAFGLEGVEERPISGDALLTRPDIDRNAITLKNVPLWDHQPLLDTFAQIQEIRTYYDFVSVDNDRYVIDGEYRQIMLSARELNSESLQNKTWINEHLTFTHGYGLTLGPVNQVTPEGLPMLFIKNLPPESAVDLRVDEPSIYFGELSNDHVFVRTRTKEFHYPKGEDNVMTTYEGRGGVNVGSLFRKLLFSIRFRSLKMLLSNDFSSDSRVLFHRRIAERVEQIAPFLTYDPDPYLAVDQGRLFWILDAYTTSDRYPYATPGGNVNYIRNSIKVVIDAYHGTTTFYRIDEKDPVAATLDKAFPGLFKPFREMPDGLRKRLRYPQTIFAIQAAMFSTFHMENPAVFYNKEDQWEVPSVGTREQAKRMEPYYSIMRLPGEKDAEFIQMLPFTPRQKDNLAAWMVARSDGDHYGKLVVFQFPKQKVIFGPRQVIARINQDQVISPQITLWNQQGSEVIQGTLLVIPIEESVMYVRPLYLRASGGRIPELKRVIVVYQNTIVMADTLETAVDRIFPKSGARPAPGTIDATAETTTAAGAGAEPGASATAAGETSASALESPSAAGASAGSAATGTGAARATLSTLAAEAEAHYTRALKAQREGNWALYGEEWKKLGDVLERMKKASK
jgi:uncharacterized membrane protein (UPF0182 family)